MNPLLKEIRRNLVLWLWAFVPVVFVTQPNQVKSARWGVVWEAA
jgi:hypothetical protein